MHYIIDEIRHCKDAHRYIEETEGDRQATEVHIGQDRFGEIHFILDGQGQADNHENVFGSGYMVGSRN